LNEKVDLENFEKSTATFSDIMERGLPIIESTFTKKLFNNYSPDEVVGKSIKDKRGGKDNIHSWDIDLKGKTSLCRRFFYRLRSRKRCFSCSFSKC
jgi:DNA (cytosine-5)-methyltransferase 1